MNASFLSVPFVLKDLFSNKILFVTVPLAVFCGVFGLFFKLYQESILPTPYFSSTPTKVRGSAQLWIPPRSGVQYVMVFGEDKRKMLFDCFPIQRICDQYAFGQEIGNVEAHVHHIKAEAYWPDSVWLDGKLVLTSESSFTAYQEYRDYSMSAFLIAEKISLLLLAYSIAIFVKERIVKHRGG
ncbi:MAG: hypothetical protein KJZ92_01365 [Rhodocyclaceae bacterium]|jgi:hypothetical protein|nr:hypothetical protein [Rhodocyclaceae bacterium]